MKWNEIKRIAIEKGFQLNRRGKKHDLYVHPDGRMIWIERH